MTEMNVSERPHTSEVSASEKPYGKTPSVVNEPTETKSLSHLGGQTIAAETKPEKSFEKPSEKVHTAGQVVTPDAKYSEKLNAKTSLEKPHSTKQAAASDVRCSEKVSANKSVVDAKTCERSPVKSSESKPSLTSRPHGKHGPARCALCGARKITATKCPYCPKLFCLLEDLNEHVVVHSSSFSCMVCDEVYDSMLQLTEHVKIHRVTKLCKCQRCGKKFSDQKHLDRHTNLHLYGGPRARVHLHVPKEVKISG